MTRRLLRGVAAAAVVAAVVGWGAVAASAKPILMLTMKKEAQAQRAIWKQHVFAPVGSLQPPAPPCPENGMLPSPFSNCGLPEFPATTLPVLGNMAYYGGHVQTTPKEYLVFWGWGEQGAFPSGQSCSAEYLTEGSFTATLACDPDGAGKYMADFVQQLGGTDWAGVQTQYYYTDSSGTNVSITNPSEQLAGIWADDGNDATGMPSTSASNPPGSTNTYTVLAQEAARAVAHFGITDLANANIIIAQPPGFSRPQRAVDGLLRVPRRERERRQVRLGRGEPPHRLGSSGADSGRAGQHHGQRRRPVRRPVPMEQRLRGRRRLLRRRGHGPADRLTARSILRRTRGDGR